MYVEVAMTLEPTVDPHITNTYRVGTPGAGPYGIAVGPDGALWITLIHSGAIARLSDDQCTVYELDSPTCRPAQITTGPDGALWFTRSEDDASTG